MNRIYRLIFNPCLGLTQVASEVTTRTCGGSGSTSIGRSGHGPRRLALAVALAAALSGGSAFAACTTVGFDVTCARGSTINHVAGSGDARTAASAGTVFGISSPPGGNVMRTLGTAAGNAVTVPEGETLEIGSSTDGTYSESIDGAGSVVKVGAGTETLTGTNTYTGGTLVNAGTLAIGAGGSLAATGAVTLTDAGTGFDISAGGDQDIGVLHGVAGSTVSLGGNTLTLGGVGNGTFDGAVTGTGGLVKNGSGIQTLGGANTFSSGVVLNAGGLVLGNNGALGTGSLSVGGNATLDTNAALTLANGINLAADTQLDFLGSNALTIGGAITGAGGLVKNGASTLTLTAANAYAGDTTINAGTLAIAAGGSVESTGAVNLAGSGLLQVLDGSQVGSGSGSIDSNADSGGGVEVIGPGSSWKVGAGSFLIGDAGTGRLRIEDGGTVESQSAAIGHGFVDYDEDAIGSSVEVIGSGTTWTNAGELLVGENSLATMEVLVGGQVQSGSVYLGTNIDSEGRIRVNGFDGGGVNSHLAIDGDLLVGDAGIGKLLVDNAGVVNNANGIIGNAADSTDSRALVTGTGSTWTNRGRLSVGSGGEGILEVLDGGHVESTSGFIGLAKGSDGKVRVSGVDSAGTRSSWEITGDPLDRDEHLLVGQFGSGLLIVEAGGTVGSSESSIGEQAGSVGKAVVTGANSSWVNGNINVGVLGRGTLLVESGGTVSSSTGAIGFRAGSVGEVMVTGAGSRLMLTSPNNFFIGHEGSGTLLVEAGGQVSSALGSIGHYAGSSSQVTVTGAGSRWDSSSQIYVGKAGTGSLTIQNGGAVSSTFGWLGVEGASSSGEVTVTGAGSSWINSDGLYVGHIGTGTLLVEAGGTVGNQDAFIGNEAGSAGKATVTGAGSTWTNGFELHVGSRGTGVLEILHGGRVEGWDLFISRFTGSDGELKLSGTDSTLSLVGGLFVGYEGSGTLLVEAGGSLSSGSVSIANRGSPGAKATATGSGTTWNSGALFLGNGGGLGELEILDGAMVNSGLTQVGQNSDGTALVDGPGSQWYVGPLVVNSAHHAQVVIRNGGLLSSATGIVGNLGDFTGTVRIQGAGSAWINLEDLYIGSFIQEPGTGALTIDDGGRVEVHAGNEDFDVMLARIAGSTGTLNIGAGGAAGVLDSASVTGGDGNAILNFNHDEADYAFTNDGTAGGTAVLIDGTTTVNQIGTGTTTLLGANSYTGATNVDAGTLLVEGSLGNTATTVADGATLGGSGSIAGAVTIADGGILAPGSSAGTLTVGSLSLSSGSILDYELGQAGVIGGGVNDLIEVTGNLTLDGTLDITDIGGFGAGVYRLINYGGDLTDHGLEIGTRPAGADTNDLTVQTGFDGQVNLASTAGLMLGFWDGATGHDNDAIDGGNGTWNVDNNNWTTADGATNGRWDNGTFAVFGGTAGNVDVVGEQAIAGLQFMSGYTLTTGTDGALHINGADSVIRVDPDVTATIATPITGAGGLVKTDTGTLVLSGTNTYEGGTRIDLGTLQVASDANLGDAAGGIAFDGGTLQTTAAFDSARDVDLQAGGGTFLTDADLGFGGAISGAGTLTKAGEGTLTLSGENSYTGGTRVLGGTLVGDTKSIRGNLANNGTVVFEQADDDTFAGKIAGSGTMAKRGAGTLTLTGSSALDWRIDAGALASRSALFSGDVRIADGALLRFGEQGDGRYGGTLSGTGAFEIAGDGIFVLTGNSAGFAGMTSLESGTLQMDGSLGGSTLIANGAVLTGIGRLGSVDNHGTIAPGNSIGTLTLTGDYIHRDDAILLAEIEPGGDSDLLDIAGSATIEGGTVEIVKLPGQYEGGTRYTLIDAVGGVTGAFGTLDQDLPFLDLLLGYDANHVYLDVQRSEADFDIVCGTGTFNQCQVAGALDAIGHDHPIPDDLKTVLTEVTSLTLPGAQAAFDTLSGEAHGSLAGILLEGHALHGQAVSQRIAERRGQTGGERLQGGAWVRAYGASSDLDGDGNAHAVDFEQRGLAVGFDAWGGEQWLIGASFNAMSVDADFRPGDRGEAEAKNASLYATFQGEHAYLDAVTSFAWWNNELTRAIVVGDLDRRARSEYGGHRFATHLEAGWNFTLGQAQQLIPLVSVEYAKLDQEGFHEEGAQDLDLVGRSQDVERTTVTAGLRWTTAFERGDWTFEPTMQARWLHAFGDEHAEQVVAFAGAPEIGYRVRGVSWPQDRGLLGIGMQLRRGDNLDLFVDVDYQKGGGLEARNLGAGLRWRW